MLAGNPNDQPIQSDHSDLYTSSLSYTMDPGPRYLSSTDGNERYFESLPRNNSSHPAPYDIDQQDIGGKTELHRTIGIGDFVEVSNLLSRGARVDIHDNEGNQPLHIAAAGNYPNIIRMLLKSGAKVNAKGHKGMTPVHSALCFPEALRAVLGGFPNLSIADDDGNTALHVSLRKFPKNRRSNGGIIEKLLRRGADVNAPNHAGVTPFHMAIELVSFKYMESYVPLFLEHGADINLRTKFGERPFEVFLANVWRAQKSDWWRGISAFLEKGANPNTVTPTGDKLLYAAFDNPYWLRGDAHYEILLQLCRTASIDAPSINGDFPLHCVLKPYAIPYLRHLFETADALLIRGADPNQRNRCGERPLQMLLSPERNVVGIKAALKSLLDHGANPMLVDSSGKSPVYVAYRMLENSDGKELLKMLVDAYIESPEMGHESNNSQPNSVWWRTYRAFRLQEQWGDEASQLLEAVSSLSEDQAKELPKHLLSLAAEEKLQAAKDRLKSYDERTILDQNAAQTDLIPNVVRVLRDCKQFGINIDISWYDFLLDIMPR